MRDISNTSLPERNPATRELHQKQVLWQITVPLVIGVLAMLGLCGLTTFASSPTASRWSDISLIWLLIPSIFFALVLLILTAGIAYGIILLVRKTPGWMLKLQNLFISLGAAVRRLDDSLVEPFLRIKSFDASVAAFRDSLWRKKRV